MKIANVALISMNTNRRKFICWLRKGCPDIITLQKIGQNAHFPTTALCKAGYTSKFLGSRSRSDLGVAILSHSRLPMPEVHFSHLPGAEQVESRFLTVNIGGRWVSSIYAPCGPPIARTVDWLHRLRDHVYKEGYYRRDSLLCGDFNVTADGPPMNGQGRKALDELLRLGFVDLYRKAHPHPNENPGHTRGYSEQFPIGLCRLYLILASTSLAQRLRSACVDVKSRRWPRKDAPPLVVELDGAYE